MASVKLYLRNPVKNKECSIYYYISIARGNRIRGATNITVKQEFWNPDTQLLRNKIGVTKSKDDINKKLKNFESFVYDQIGSYHTKNQNEIKRLLKNDIEVYFNKKKEEKRPLNLLEFYDWYIEHYKIHPLPTTGNILGKGTAKTYKNAYRIIREFNDAIYKVDFKSITVNFYDDFIAFLTDQDYSLNYIGTQIKVLKTIMGSSFEKDLHQNLDFKKKYFRKPSEDVSNIYLTLEELKSIENVDLSNFKDKITNKNLKLTKDLLDRARDLFLIGCYTGLRISDYRDLNAAKNIIEEDGAKYLRLKSKKTGKFVTIPMSKVIKNILKKNNGEFPSKIPEQHLNYAIKEVGELAKIKDKFSKEITKGGKRIEITKYKYEFISSHTARRSFCTNAYLAGMPVYDIMQLSNHSTEKVFYNYIKVKDIGRAKKIGNHNFFK